MITSGFVAAPGTANVTVKIVTDADSWSSTSSVDDGTLTGFSIVSNRIRLATVTDTIIGEKVGSVVRVNLNGQDVEDLSFSTATPVQRVYYNDGSMSVTVLVGVGRFCFDWPVGYAEAPVTNYEVTRWYRIARVSPNPNPAFINDSMAKTIPYVDYLRPCWDQACPATFTADVIRLSTPDAWSDSDAPVSISC